MRYPPTSAVQGLPWQNPSVIFSDGDIAKARAILEEAGWKINSAGVREKAGKEARLTLWYASGDSTRRDLAEAVRAMLQPFRHCRLVAIGKLGNRRAPYAR